ncbi:hypothetical protein TSMEX_000681 [Taenia solium]|eukprot:TsM_000693100 transcript=TsM_000693100 gene=TsM_000693100
MVPELTRLGEAGEMDFDEGTINALRSALTLLSALFEWSSLNPLVEWRAPEQLSPSETAGSIQLLLFLLRLPKLRIEAADVLSVMLTKKQGDVVAGKGESTDITNAYTYLFAFTDCSSQDPITIILEISSTVEFDDNACKFMHRWAEVIALLGSQVVEDWEYFEGKGPVALKAFDFLVQANAFAAAHPSRLSSPTTTDYVAAWIYANYEKDDYLDFLTSKSSICVRYLASPTETRSYVKSNCLLLSASLWPVEVLRYLINWHKRMLGEDPKPEDLILPSQPFINRTSTLIRQWEGLSFAMDKTVACAYSGNVLIPRTAAVATPTPLTSLAERETGRSILLAHLRDSFATAVADLPADPGMRQYHLSILHTLVISCVEGTSEFIPRLLMQVRFGMFDRATKGSFY